MSTTPSLADILRERIENKPKYEPPSVPEGDYDVEIVGAEERQSLNGNMMLRLRVRVVGRRMCFWDWLVYTKKAYWKLDSFLIAIDATSLSSDFEAEGIDANIFIGRRVRARLNVIVYQDEKQNEIAAWLPPESPPSAAQTEPAVIANSPVNLQKANADRQSAVMAFPNLLVPSKVLK